VKRILGIALAGLAGLFFLFGSGGPFPRGALAADGQRGRGEPRPATGGSAVIARLPGLDIAREQVLAPLIEAHGLPVLINVVQLELAKQNAQRAGVTVTDADVAAERKVTLSQAFNDDVAQKLRQQIDDAVAKNDQATAQKLRRELERDQELMLDQLLAQQKVSRPEFELVLRTNAHLRKLAERELKDKPITDDVLRKRFETEYGASVRVKHIQGSSAAELQKAKARVTAGEPFEKVAKQVSRNARTGPLGGELPRFSLATPNIPDNFKEVAFALKEGEVSDVVACEDAYHLIKLEQKFAPRAVKFESVKDSLLQRVREQLVQGAITHLREQLAEQTRNHLKIDDPVLREQFARRLDDRDKQIQEMEKIEAQQLRERMERQAAPPAPLGNPPQPGVPQQPPAQLPGQPGQVPVDPSKVLPVPQPAQPADGNPSAK